MTMRYTAVQPSNRPTYAIPGLPWGCSPEFARHSLEGPTLTIVGELSPDGVLPFQSEENGYRVQGEAHFTHGALTCVRTTCIAEDDDAPPPAVFLGELSKMFQRAHGPYETTDNPAPNLIVRQWPSGERGSLRMTLNRETQEIVILCHSGVAD